MMTIISHQRSWQRNIFLILFLQLQLIVIVVFSSTSEEQENEYIHFKVHMPIKLVSGHHHIISANRLHQPKELKIAHNPVRYHHLLYQHSQHPSLPRALPPKNHQESHSNRFFTPLSTSGSVSASSNFGGHHPKVDPFLPVLPYQLISSHANLRPKSLPYIKLGHFPLKSSKNKEILLGMTNGKNKLLSSPQVLSPIAAATSATSSHDVLQQELVMLPQNTASTTTTASAPAVQSKNILWQNPVAQSLTRNTIHTSPFQKTTWNSNKQHNNYSMFAPLTTPSSYIVENRYKQKDIVDRTKNSSVVYKSTIINSTVNSSRIPLTTLTPRLTSSSLSFENLYNNSNENRNSKQHLIMSSEKPYTRMVTTATDKQQLLQQQYIRQQMEKELVLKPTAFALLQREEMRGSGGRTFAAKTNDNTSEAIMTMIGSSNRRPSNIYENNKQYNVMASSKSLSKMPRKPSRTNTLITTTMATLGDIWSLPLKPTAQSLLMTNKFPQKRITTDSGKSIGISRTIPTTPTYNNHKNLLAFRPQVNLKEGQRMSLTTVGFQSKPIASTLHQNVNDANNNNNGKRSRYQFVSAAEFENILNNNDEEESDNKAVADLPQSLQNYIDNLYHHPQYPANESRAKKEPLIKWSTTKLFNNNPLPIYQNVNDSSSTHRWPPSMVALQNEVLPYKEYPNGYVIVPALFDESIDFNQSNSKMMAGKDKVEPLSYHWHQQHYVPHTEEIATSYREKITTSSSETQYAQKPNDTINEENKTDEIIDEIVNADHGNNDSLSDETVP